tara:strand:+ start:741 stop:1148 length:408 start_codon:yes stop_codon:yes gene_type:complete
MKSEPLKVTVETKDGRVRSVVLCMGKSDAIQKMLPPEHDDDISYYNDEATKPEELIGQPVFGIFEEDGDTIVKIHNVEPFNTPDKADPVLVRVSFEDVVVTKEERNSGKHEVGDSYFVCYEDQDGRECDEDGNYI